jgi:hypothetical protein
LRLNTSFYISATNEIHFSIQLNAFIMEYEGFSLFRSHTTQWSFRKNNGSKKLTLNAIFESVKNYLIWSCQCKQLTGEKEYRSRIREKKNNKLSEPSQSVLNYFSIYSSIISIEIISRFEKKSWTALKLIISIISFQSIGNILFLRNLVILIISHRRGSQIKQ